MLELLNFATEYEQICRAWLAAADPKTPFPSRISSKRQGSTSPTGSPGSETAFFSLSFLLLEKPDMKNSQIETSIWPNYSDLTRPHPKWWFSKGNPEVSKVKDIQSSMFTFVWDRFD